MFKSPLYFLLSLHIREECFRYYQQRDDSIKQQEYIHSLRKTNEDLLEIIRNGEEYTRRLRAQLAEGKEKVNRLFGDRNVVKMAYFDLKNINDRLETDIVNLEGSLAQEKRKNAFLVKLLQDAKRKFNVEVVANKKEIRRINDEFARREASLKEKMTSWPSGNNGQQKRKTKIAEQKITELQKKLQEKNVEVFNLTQQMQNEKCGAARQRHLQSQTKKVFDEIKIAFQRGRKMFLKWKSKQKRSV
uniref:myosin-6-like n=1 Tax=Myxine glutinosa TaxID=7769 RepID=UPI00358EF9EE